MKNTYTEKEIESLLAEIGEFSESKPEFIPLFREEISAIVWYCKSISGRIIADCWFDSFKSPLRFTGIEIMEIK
jgi:hypothetical protein